MDRELGLPAWGPYSRTYAGISKLVGDGERRQMIDFIPVPGYVRGKAIIADVNYDSGYHPWAAAKDFSYYAIRYELAWKDREYCDAEFFAAPEGELLKLTYVNNSDMPKEYFNTIFAVHRYRDCAQCGLAPGELWIGGESYQDLHFAPPRELLKAGENYETFCHLGYLGMGRDGLRRGITLQSFLVDGRGLGSCLATDPRDYLAISCNQTFLMNAGTDFSFAADGKPHRFLSLRTRMEGVQSISFQLTIGDWSHSFTLTQSPKNEMMVFTLPLPQGLLIDRLAFTVVELSADESKAFVLDGILLSDEQPDQHRFTYPDAPPRFQIERAEMENGVVLRSNRDSSLEVAMYSPDERDRPPRPYSDCTISSVYNFDLSGSRVLRKLNNDALLNWGIHNVQIYGDGENHFCGYNLSPIVCPPHERRTVYAALACTQEPGYAKLNAAGLYARRQEIEQCGYRVWERGQQERETRLCPNPYAFSQEKLMTNLLTNVTFPVYIEDGFYPTYTPGKRWGGLFTWDSGMLGIGLLQYAPEQAIKIVRQYFVDASNGETDAILHGTQLPLHIYLLLEWYQRTKDKQTLSELYPSAKKYYAYFAGISKLSSYDKFHTGLLCPFEDGYNVEGIDDYPPQHAAGLAGLYDRMSPVCTSAHAIRTGKIMKLFAFELHRDADIAEYDAHNRYLSQALEKYAWDEPSGYYAYVENGCMQKYWYDDAHTINYNMGIDGLSPIIAGCMNDRQLAAAKKHLLTPGHMWTPYGIVSVDQRAPYARNDGYWNGKVWIPHQWFFWKSLLTAGEVSGARKIALTALNVWKSSVEDTYNCYEQFCSMTGMGEGCHNFGGLSGPLAAFYYAYFGRKQITAGFDTIINDAVWNDGDCTFELNTPFAASKTGVLICTGENAAYTAVIDGVSRSVIAESGVVELVVEAPRAVTRIVLRKLPGGHAKE